MLSYFGIGGSGRSGGGPGQGGKELLEFLEGIVVKSIRLLVKEQFGLYKDWRCYRSRNDVNGLLKGGG